MSRPHGHAQIDARYPRATAICDRCGRMVNHDRLQWQYDFQRGPRLFNLRILVCESCLDVPQQNGRTIVLPPDPVPIRNPRPENYVNADNPVSPLNWSPSDNFVPRSSLSGNIGTLVNNGGIDAAFYQAGKSSAVNSTSPTALFSPQTAALVNKRFEFCAALSVSDSSYGNTVGKYWNAYPSGVQVISPSTVAAIQHVVSGFTAYAPSDQPFLRAGATDWLFRGSDDGVNWTTISSGTTAGTDGEVLTVSTTIGAAYGYHQLALKGDGFSSVGVAGLSISVSDAASNDI